MSYYVNNLKSLYNTFVRLILIQLDFPTVIYLLQELTKFSLSQELTNSCLCVAGAN